MANKFVKGNYTTKILKKNKILYYYNNTSFRKHSYITTNDAQRNTTL